MNFNIMINQVQSNIYKIIDTFNKNFTLAQVYIFLFSFNVRLKFLIKMF